MDAILHAKAEIILLDGQSVTLTDEEILSDGFSYEDATSGESSFDIGSAIINKCTLRFENVDGFYHQYDFDLAKVVSYIGLEETDGSITWKKKGTYYVDAANMKESSVTLECLDNLANFDRPYYESTLSFPATLMDMVEDACEVCGVEYDGQDFANSDYVVQVRPTDDALTFRAILSYIAQLACSYVRCDVDGKVGFAWYDRSALLDTIDGGIFDVYDEALYQTGDTLDCGNFFNYGEPNHDAGAFTDTGAYHHIYDLSSQDINTSDVEVTGLQVSGVEKENKSYFSTNDFYNNVYAEVRQQMTKALNAVSFSLPLSQWVGDEQSHIWCDLHGFFPGRQSYRLDFDAVGDLSGTLEVMAETSEADEAIGEVELTGTGHYTVEFELTSEHEIMGNEDTWPYLYFWIDNKAGAKITLSNFSIQKTEEEDVVRSALYGSEGYVLSIADNPLVTAATVDSIAQNIGPKVAGLRFRPLSISAVADPDIQAGDVAIVEDRLGRSYQTILTNLSFTIGAFESLSCGAETTGENSSTRYTEDSKTGVLVTEDTKKLLTEYDTQVQRFFHLMVGIFGLFRTQEGSVEYIHEKQSLADSTYIWRISKEGFMVSQNGGSTYVNAIDESGNAVLNAIDVIQK